MTVVQNTNPYTYFGTRPLNVAPGTTLDSALAMVSIRSLGISSGNSSSTSRAIRGSRFSFRPIS